MQLHPRTERQIRILTGMTLGGVAGGVFYVAARGHTAPFDLLVGMTYGLLISLTIGFAEIFMNTGPLREWFGGLSFSASVAVRGLIYASIIVPIQLFELGAVLLGLPVSPSTTNFWAATIYSVAFGILLNLVFGIVNLVGRRAFFSFVTGRYHDPVEEQRFVLFVDIAGSTTLAEKLGGRGIHRFLDKTFRLLTLTATDYRGEVLNYVGDEVIVTWPERSGAVDCRPLECFVEMRNVLARAAARFEDEFGAVPRIRGSLHFGPVVVGEIGDIKRAIVFNGDVMNIAARLEELSRGTESGFLASRAAMQRLGATPRVAIVDLGRMDIRGRADSIEVVGLAAG